MNDNTASAQAHEYAASVHKNEYGGYRMEIAITVEGRTRTVTAPLTKEVLVALRSQLDEVIGESK